jgi:hypothetical protein
MYKKVFNLTLTFLIISSLYCSNSCAQQNKKPMLQNKKQENGKNIPDWNKKVRISPKAEITQTIGLTDVTISYSRPGVKGRKIWGELVPYNKVWRAGANEATKIAFSNDVLVNGKKVPAGSYALFLIPHQKEWTVILNKVADQWGAFTYNEAQDFLRFDVKPQLSNFHEWLEYTFSDMKVNEKGINSAVLNMLWEKIRLPITIEADVN